jgi:hypothetical protein
MIFMAHTHLDRRYKNQLLKEAKAKAEQKKVALTQSPKHTFAASILSTHQRFIVGGL